MADLSEGLILTDGNDMLRAMPDHWRDAYAASLFALAMYAARLEQQLPGMGQTWMLRLAGSIAQGAADLPGLMRGGDENA